MLFPNSQPFTSPGCWCKELHTDTFGSVNEGGGGGGLPGHSEDAEEEVEEF